MKWVSLMLWAGADPFSPGLSDPGEARYDDEEPLTALGWAALYNHYDVFFLKPIRTQLPGPHASEILRYLTSGKGLDVLKQFLEKGIDPNDQDGGGCSAIPSCVEAMTWGGGLDVYQGWNYGARRGEIDTSASRDRMKAIHLFARHGGKWMPADKRKVGDVRRSLLKMTPDYTVEFVWIMQKYASCKREPVVELLRTPSIRTHVASHWERLRQLIDAWNEDPEPEH